MAGNTDGNGSDPDCDGTMTSLNYNHIGSTTGCSFTSQSNDAVNSPANMALLANNGGTTLTHLPNPGSPVTNTANAAVCPTLDQRGYGRNGTCDKGAAEFGGIAPTAILTKTYYFAGAQLIAMREITTTGLAGTLYYLHQDHLGSTSLTTNNSGAVVSRQLFYAYGEVRWSTGMMPTTIGYTGQRRDSGLGSLMFYNARYYSPLLSRFVSADTIVPEPGNPQAFNRYSYVMGNPLRYIDPSGHSVDCGIGDAYCKAGKLDVKKRAHDLITQIERRKTPFVQLTAQNKSILAEGGFKSEATNEEVYNDFVNGNGTELPEDEWLFPEDQPDLPLPTPEQLLEEARTNTWIKDFLGNKWTPVGMSALTNLALEVDAIASKSKHRFAILVRGGAILTAWIASAAGTASTLYQHNNNLYGTTRVDVAITMLSFIPVASTPNIDTSKATLPLAHASFFYTLFRTVGILESP